MKRIIIGQCYETLLKRIPPWPIVIAGEVNDWHGRHDDHLKERTVAKQDPTHARGRKWWWTHERLRRAYFRLVRLNRAGVLFAFCDPAVLKGGGAHCRRRPTSWRAASTPWSNARSTTTGDCRRSI